jgi:hypothetical protein
VAAGNGVAEALDSHGIRRADVWLPDHGPFDNLLHTLQE